MLNHYLGIQFLLFLFLGGLAAYGGLSFAANACRYAPSVAAQAAQPQLDQNDSDAPKQDPRPASTLDEIAHSLAALVDLERSKPKEANSEERRSQWQQESWWGKFWCDVKASDVLIAFFTYALFIVGWFAIRRADRLAGQLERAYVSGGGPWLNGGPLFPQVIGFQLTADNYGKSPATIVEYALEICDVSNIPRIPEYKRRGYYRTPLRATLKPDEKGLVIANRPITQPIANPVSYGRICISIFGNDAISTVSFFRSAALAEAIPACARLTSPIPLGHKNNIAATSAVPACPSQQ